jgi:hypothetical protein
MNITSLVNENLNTFSESSSGGVYKTPQQVFQKLGLHA